MPLSRTNTNTKSPTVFIHCFCRCRPGARREAPPAGCDPSDGALSVGGQSLPPPLPGAAAAPAHDRQGGTGRGALLQRRALRPPGRLHQGLCAAQRRPQVGGQHPPGPQRDADVRAVRHLQGGRGGRLAAAPAHLREQQSAEAEGRVQAGEEEALLLSQSCHPRLQLGPENVYSFALFCVNMILTSRELNALETASLPFVTLSVSCLGSLGLAGEIAHLTFGILHRSYCTL